MTSKRFRTEANERLTDWKGVAAICGIPTRQNVWKAVRVGRLPAPIVVFPNCAVWDRQDVAEHVEKWPGR